MGTLRSGLPYRAAHTSAARCAGHCSVFQLTQFFVAFADLSKGQQGWRCACGFSGEGSLTACSSQAIPAVSLHQTNHQLSVPPAPHRSPSHPDATIHRTQYSAAEQQVREPLVPLALSHSHSFAHSHSYSLNHTVSLLPALSRVAAVEHCGAATVLRWHAQTCPG